MINNPVIKSWLAFFSSACKIVIESQEDIPDHTFTTERVTGSGLLATNLKTRQIPTLQVDRLSNWAGERAPVLETQQIMLVKQLNSV